MHLSWSIVWISYMSHKKTEYGRKSVDFLCLQCGNWVEAIKSENNSKWVVAFSAVMVCVYHAFSHCQSGLIAVIGQTRPTASFLVDVNTKILWTFDPPCPMKPLRQWSLRHVLTWISHISVEHMVDSTTATWFDDSLIFSNCCLDLSESLPKSKKANMIILLVIDQVIQKFGLLQWMEVWIKYYWKKIFFLFLWELVVIPF